MVCFRSIPMTHLQFVQLPEKKAKEIKTPLCVHTVIADIIDERIKIAQEVVHEKIFKLEPFKSILEGDGYKKEVKGLRESMKFFEWYDRCLTTNMARPNNFAASTDYVQGCGRVVFPTKHQNITVMFECGYTSESCPADISHALLLLVGTLYEQRMDISVGIQTYKAYFSSEHLLQPHKLY